MVLLRLVFLDNEYSSEVFQILLAVTHVSNVARKSKSSRPEVFCKNDVFENFANQKCFSMNFAKFSRTPPVVPSEKLKAEAILRRCSVKKVFLKISQTKCVLL